ncbi:uncharacterized protein [Dermacentor albipictus]|uniref:uncharacterized protein n=1 Tax=Dermacentor albipictus TaxID=60249 RepID=UPI0038FC1016
MAAVKRLNPDGTPWQPPVRSRICGAHFITASSSAAGSCSMQGCLQNPHSLQKKAVSDAAMLGDTTLLQERRRADRIPRLYQGAQSLLQSFKNLSCLLTLLEAQARPQRMCLHRNH